MVTRRSQALSSSSVSPVSSLPKAIPMVPVTPRAHLDSSSGVIGLRGWFLMPDPLMPEVPTIRSTQLDASSSVLRTTAFFNSSEPCIE